ncbi:NUDIX hydrolase [Rhodocytophaga rosea]|uniref:NUDIX hydrolase n=1 Tax=Rhodocytophaga rosea TaxID=2704465 RepID=A0A6C0GPF6_9BACT|nr:NUDIX domain-containing protein [Rhodocytophaga rosea]QHT69936.1 NUDIX hydrolase [Rhodocytophaga rosea]
MQTKKNTATAPYDDFSKFLPHISIDCCVFGFHENQLKILLIKWEKFGVWSLPGGFIFPEESVDAAAKRILQERTSLQNIFLEQFKIFGEVNRTNLPGSREMLERSEVDSQTQQWLLQRTISLGYYALVDFSKAIPTTTPLIADCRWWDISKVPHLIHDHADIVKHALKALQGHLLNKPIGLNLLPTKFTMTELRRLYETILGKTIDRRNFEKKMLKLGILDRLDEVKTDVGHKAPVLYRFNLATYDELLNADFGFGF